MVSLVDEIPMIAKGESVLYKYAAGGNAMLLEYCDMLNIENQHFYDSNEELSHQVLRLETALETLESRILHVDCWMEHCLSSHVYGDGSVENPFTLEGGDLRVSIMFDLTDPYPVDLPSFATASDPGPAHSASPPCQRSSHRHDQATASVPDDFPIPARFPIRAASLTSPSGLVSYESASGPLP